MGNRGLVAVGLDEIPPACDPVGPEVNWSSRRAFSGHNPGYFRADVDWRQEPLNPAALKEANIGGMIGKALTAHGIKLLIVEGAPANDDLFILLVKMTATLN